jgi:hypothetical protein
MRGAFLLVASLKKENLQIKFSAMDHQLSTINYFLPLPP